MSLDNIANDPKLKDATVDRIQSLVTGIESVLQGQGDALSLLSLEIVMSTMLADQPDAEIAEAKGRIDSMIESVRRRIRQNKH